MFHIGHGLEDGADRLIHAIDHRRINGHTLIHLLALGLVHGVPRRCPLVTSTNRPALIDKPHFQLPCVSLFPDFVPTFHVFAAIFFDILLQRMQRPVWRGERHIQEERLIIITRAMVADKLGAVLADGGSVVKILWEFCDRLIIQREGVGRIKTSRTGNRAKETIESPLARPIVL